MNFDQNIPIEELFDISRIDTCIIADILDGLGIWGVLDPAIMQLNDVSPSPPIAGYAYTVYWKPVPEFDDNSLPQPLIWNQLKKLRLDHFESVKGNIYVGGVEGGLLRSQAIAGGFGATHFHRNGFRGMILGGAVRDAHIVKNIPMPVWGTNFSPADAQGKYEVAEIGTACIVGGVKISTGDLIIVDASGIVVVPQAIIFDVLALATEATDSHSGCQIIKTDLSKFLKRCE